MDFRLRQVTLSWGKKQRKLQFVLLLVLVLLVLLSQTQTCIVDSKTPKVSRLLAHDIVNHEIPGYVPEIQMKLDRGFCSTVATERHKHCSHFHSCRFHVRLGLVKLSLRHWIASLSRAQSGKTQNFPERMAFPFSVYFILLPTEAQLPSLACARRTSV